MANCLLDLSSSSLQRVKSAEPHGTVHLLGDLQCECGAKVEAWLAPGGDWKPSPHSAHEASPPPRRHIHDKRVPR
jgi:hypothetical protein